jgi:hypothetical protein
MSNYNFQDLPESLAEYADQIGIAAEVINATGDVQLRFFSGDPDAAGTESVFLHLKIRQARDLAEAIWQAACEADWATARDRAVTNAERPRYLRCGKPAQLVVDASHADLGPCVLQPEHDGDCSLVRP